MSADRQAGDSTRPEPQSATEISGGTAWRPVLLSIAGFDPSSGAGVTADLKVFAAHGIYGMACITALTVQSTQGVRAVEAVSAPMVAETLKMLAEDVTFAGVKLGMLATGEICDAVADFLDRMPAVPVVLDPVLRSSSGRELLNAAGIGTLRGRLLGRVNWITPNSYELSKLAGLPVARRQDVPAAAARLRELAKARGNGRLNVLATGGHLDRPDDYLLTAAEESCWLPGEWVATSATHGTGCALSSALLCRLARGDGPLASARGAKEYVVAAMRASYPVGAGKGPIHHLFERG